MLTKREYKLSRTMIVTQVIISILLFLSVDLFYPDHVFTHFQQIFLIAQLAVIWYYLFSKFRLGVIFRILSLRKMIRGYLVTLFLGCGLMLLELQLIPILRHIPLSTKYILYFFAINLITLVLFKVAFYYSMRILRRKGYNSRQIIIIADSVSLPFVSSFIAAKDWGYKIVYVISPESKLKLEKQKIKFIPDYIALKKLLFKRPVDDIFYCLAIDDKRYDLDQLLKDTKEIGMSLHIMQKEYLEKVTGQVQHNNRFDNSFTTYQTTPKRYFGIKTKEIFDFIFSLLVLLFLSPLFVLIALLIKYEDGGPVFFRQERIGLNGRRFMCHKFRSMVVNAEELKEQLEAQNESDGPTFKIENDPRITKIGRFLRKTSLDELPQFYNVVKSEMSIVGPRPPLLKEVQQYEPSQRRRLSMKPGITCSWQVWGRHQVTFNEWMNMDLDYIDNWSTTMDMKIILSTIGVIFKANGH